MVWLIVVVSAPTYSWPVGPSQTALARHEISCLDGGPTVRVHTGVVPRGLAARGEYLRFLVEARRWAGPLPFVPIRVGEEPKSQSWPWPAVPGACHACSSFSDADRCTMDNECPIWLPAGQTLTVGSHSLPVDTHRSLPFDVAATLDHTPPPIHPLA